MRRRRHTLYGLLLTLGILAGAPWALTQAVWGDQENVGGNAFSTGSVDIAASPASAALSLSDMAPGDKSTATLSMSNAGTLDLRYSMTTGIAASSTLADGLTLRVKESVTDCSNGGFDGTGTSLYSGALSGGAFGDPTQGADAGDRALAAGAGEDLCFQVELPSGAANTLQSLSTTATFTFDAEQVANN